MVLYPPLLGGSRQGGDVLVNGCANSRRDVQLFPLSHPYSQEAQG